MLRVPVHKLEAGETTLDSDASRYVARVRRAGEGDAIVLFEPRDAREADATIVSIGRAGVRCNVGAVRASTARPRRRATLLQAIGKGEKIDAIVRDATELGATRVVVVETQRSVVRLGGRAEARRERWRRVAIEAARQCRRGDIPELVGPIEWPIALAIGAEENALRICLWENATQPLAPMMRNLSPQRPVVFAVGPEGGLEAQEIDLARSRGYAIASLGPFILRTETVAAAVLGAALALGSDSLGG